MWDFIILNLFYREEVIIYKAQIVSVNKVKIVSLYKVWNSISKKGRKNISITDFSAIV